MLANEKFPKKMPLVTFFHWYVDNLNPENEKNRVSPFGEKPILISYLLNEGKKLEQITKGSM